MPRYFFVKALWNNRLYLCFSGKLDVIVHLNIPKENVFLLILIFKYFEIFKNH